VVPTETAADPRYANQVGKPQAWRAPSARQASGRPPAPRRL